MAVNVEVLRGKVESNASVLKRFSRRVQESGVVVRLKGERYLEREKSRNHRRVKKLGSIARKTERGATRGDDRFSEAAMEDRKKEGYF